jgi:hypothetical protein
VTDPEILLLAPIRTLRSSYPGLFRLIQRWWAAAFVLLITVGLFGLFNNTAYDDPYITYRYASNLAAGQGFVYNAGERVLSTTTPLQVLVLAGFSFLWSDIPKLAVLTGSLSLALAALALWDLFQASKLPTSAWIAVVFLPIFPQVFMTLGGELPLYLALGIGAFACYFRRRYYWASLCAALVALARPDGLLISLFLGLHFLLIERKPIPRKAIWLFLVIQGLWWGFAWVYFSSPLPVTLFTKHQQGLMLTSELFVPGFISMLRNYTRNGGYWLEALLAGLGLFLTVRKKRFINLLLLWTGVYFLAYWLLSVSRSYWYYTPLVPGFIACMGLGVESILNSSRQEQYLFRRIRINRWMILFLVMLSLFFSAGTQLYNLYRIWSNPDRRYQPYREIGEWLAHNTPPDASVGTLEIGIIGYYSHRSVVDFAGLIQPDVATRMSSETSYADTALWAVEKYHPTYLVLHDGLFLELEETYVSRYCHLKKTFPGLTQQLEIYACVYTGE